MSIKRIGGRVDKELWIEFKIAAIKKFEGRQGAISRALEEAIRLWLERNKNV